MFSAYNGELWHEKGTTICVTIFVKILYSNKFKKKNKTKVSLYGTWHDYRSSVYTLVCFTGQVLNIIPLWNMAWLPFLCLSACLFYWTGVEYHVSDCRSVGMPCCTKALLPSLPLVFRVASQFLWFFIFVLQ
jgi:hypothetical protein